jgi:germination protein YpeB
MPAHTFNDGDPTVSITKNGGYFVYMLKYRNISEKSISIDRAVELGEEYLKSIGHDNMVHTYYEIKGGVCVINFAGYVDSLNPTHSGEEPMGEPVTVYTDTVKVGVALDNGEIISFDARAYISAHHARTLGQPAVSKEDAASKISSNLSVQNVKLAVIPSSGEHERLCWEVLCKADNGNNVLVYVNANSGIEEKIMLMKISDNGTFVV